MYDVYKIIQYNCNKYCTMYHIKFIIYKNKNQRKWLFVIYLMN